jgi:hypothetical protein
MKANDMDDLQRLTAIDKIREAKARYLRGTDTGEPALVRAMLAEDCVLDFRKCWTDPTTGEDLLPEINVVMKGSASWSPEGFAALGVVSEHTSAHHCYSYEVEFTDDDTAQVTWAMTDRLFMPPGGKYKQLTGYGYYHDTFVRVGDAWKLEAMHISRLRVEGSPA